MYSVICKFRKLIVAAISSQEVAEYEWLQQNTAKARTPQYQARFRNFWTMNVARLSDGFYASYFGLLSNSATQSLTNLCETLHGASLRSDGRQTLQFSFATKLRHTLDPHLPIYDSRVARFFLFREPPSDLPLEERISRLMVFYDFLRTEYARVINDGLLVSAVSDFRQQFNPSQHTDEKIIDWLVWAFVGLADNGALLKSEVAYG